LRTSKILVCSKIHPADAALEFIAMKGYAVIGLAALLSAAAHAHHSGAAFDRSQRVEVKGAVERVEWSSPHARLYVAGKDDAGKAVTWDFELPSPVTLMRRGWSKSALAVGDVVTVTGAPAREFPHIAIATGVIDKNGQRLFSGAAGSE
jgi:hypothetical protein